MNFEKFSYFVGEKTDKTKKKIKNIAKIAAIGAIGIMPMASQAGENHVINKEGQGTESIINNSDKEKTVRDAWEMISSDCKAGQQAETEYYYSEFPQINKTIIDSLMQKATDEFVAVGEKQEKDWEDYQKQVANGEINLDLLSENHHSGLTPAQRQKLNQLYPDQVKKDPDFRGVWVPPTE